ncbi:MAG: helix-turn-helix transcriptional regulator [Bacteroidota bacterium]
MDVAIDVTKNLLDQFSHYLRLIPEGGNFIIHPDIGTNNATVRYVTFPGELELYHFGLTQFKVPINMRSVNPPDTEWFIIHINLSNIRQEKVVNGSTITFQKYLPIGLLLYGPNLVVDTLIPPGVDAEVATIRFSKQFLQTYFSGVSEVIDVNRNIVFEDLDQNLESLFLRALETIDRKLECHLRVLKFLQAFFEKTQRHDQSAELEDIHPDDLKGIFKVSAILRNPLQNDAPSLQELAQQANMGVTKFKTTFKKVFGKPPMEYRNRIRMEFAHEELIHQRQTPTEVSYRLGYSHPSNFTAAYKKYFGKLPSAH